MKAHRALPYAVIALAALSMGAGCPTVPQVEDRIVELALGASASQEFVASGSLGTHDDTEAYDLSQLDLRGILDDAGVDPSDVTAIAFSGAQYRITQAQAGRTITNGNVTAARGLGSPVSLITNFSADCGSVTDWITAPVDAPGVTLINGVLTDALANVQNGTPIPNPVVSVHVHGDTQATPADFTYEIKLNLTIVGKFKLKVLN